MGLTLGKSRLGKTNSRSVEAFLRLGVGLAAAGGHGHGRPGIPGSTTTTTSTTTSTIRTRMHSRAVSRTVSVAKLTQAGVGSPGVLYVDRGVIVLNKPPGLVSQGTSRLAATRTRTAPPLASQELTPAPAPHGSAFDDVLNDLRQRFDLGGNPYPVHRLDKGTTGVLILARTKALARELSRQFRTHDIAKTYLALVRGAPGDWAGTDTGTGAGSRTGLITAPLSLDDDGRVRVHRHHHHQLKARVGSADLLEPGHRHPDVGSVVGSGKAARTAWEVLASSSDRDVAPLSLVRLQPHTGLKHQLRVHMARVLGAPILGDNLYGVPSTTTTPLVSSIPRGRLFLHSSSISFWRYRRDGPGKRFRLTITAPLPADFAKVCQDMNLDLPEDVIQGGGLIDGERLEEEIPGVEGRWIGKPISA